MKLKILFFANFKELLGLSELELEFEEGARVAELNQVLSNRGPLWQKVFQSRSIKVAVNHELAELDSVLKEGDEVAYFPPVTGG